MALPAGSSRRGGVRSPADEAWAAGALLGVAGGLGAVALLFGPPAFVLVVAGLACAAAAVGPLVQRPVRAPPRLARPPARPARRGPESRRRRLPGLLRSAVSRRPALIRPRELASVPAPPPTVRRLPSRPRPAVEAPVKPVAEGVAGPVELPVPVPAPAPGAAEAPEPDPVPVPAVRHAPAPSPPAPLSPEDAYELACRLQAEGQVGAAERGFAQAAAGGHRLGALALGQLAQARGSLEEAMAAYRQVAVEADSLGATACLSLGVLLDGCGDLAGAAAAYRRAAYTGGPAGESAALLLRWLESRDQRLAA